MPSESTRTSVRYEVNGVQYDCLEDVPAEFRKYFEDKNNNGLPDFIESAAAVASKSDSVLRMEKRILHTSSSLGPDAQRLLTKAARQLLANNPDAGGSREEFDRTSPSRRSAGQLVVQLVVDHPTVAATIIAAMFLLTLLIVWVVQKLM